MKKNALLLFMLMVLLTKAQTSVYHPFPDSAATWNIDASKWCGLGFDFWQHLYSITISGDTLINANKYHKLSVPAEIVKTNGMCDSSGTWVQKGYYAGSFREDRPAKKVYFIPPAHTNEQLLYDFNLQVGDSVKGYIKSFTGTPETVKAIDSVLVGNTYRKRWKINSVYDIYIIEGIGSTYGLIKATPGTSTDPHLYLITCFSQNGIPLYPSTSTNCDLIITSDERPVKDKPVINIFPNPSKGSFNINYSQTLNITAAYLTDLPGNLILKPQLNNPTNFNIDALPGGTYILTLIDKNQVSTHIKIISCP